MNIWQILNGHQKIIDSYIDKMKDNNYQEILSDIYKYVKSVTDIYYEEGLIREAYGYLRNSIISKENILPYGKLLDVPIRYSQLKESDIFMERIVYIARKYLVDKYTFYGNYNINIEDMDFSDYCKKAAEYIKSFCDKHNIESYILPIYPGYEKRALLYCGSGYHFANIIKRNNKYYLIDVTYSQFFYEKRNNLDRLGVVNISGCDPGIFMLMTDNGKTIATTLLEDGYIELNEEILKTYLDSFTISFRNGLYYETTSDLSYTASYSVDDYINFLKGKDNQINHEGKENLGYQKRPLRNWNFDFQKSNRS